MVAASVSTRSVFWHLGSPIYFAGRTETDHSTRPALSELAWPPIAATILLPRPDPRRSAFRHSPVFGFGSANLVPYSVAYQIIKNFNKFYRFGSYLRFG